MSLPSNIASITPIISNFLSPDDLIRTELLDYELGGTALNDSSEGLDFQKWTLTYSDPDVIATPDNGTDIVLFSLAGLTEISLAFDQNMAPFVTYVLNSESWYWWWDPVASAQLHVQMATGVVTPRCTMDDKRLSQVAASDIILAYIRSGSLYYRQQRDRFTIEYLLDSTALPALNRIGMADNLRLHFEYLDGSNVPPESVELPEIVTPYWDNLIDNGRIDLTKTTITTFEATFGLPVEGADFQSVIAVGGSATPIASLVNTLEGGNRLQFIDSSDATDAVILIVDSAGNLIESILYADAVTTDYVTIPTGGNYYVVTSSNSGNALIKKWNSSAIDLTGSTPYATFFGSNFGDLDSVSASMIIPAEGISIAFTVPITTDVVDVLFTTIGLTGVSTTRTIAINRSVGDFDTPPRLSGIVTGITGGINLTGKDISLVTGQVYIINAKNDTPQTSNWIRLYIRYRVVP